MEAKVFKTHEWHSCGNRVGTCDCEIFSTVYTMDNKMVVREKIYYADNSPKIGDIVDISLDDWGNTDKNIF
jgi:hypothetical protein